MSKSLIFAAVLAMAFPASIAQADNLKLTSLDWPPYSGKGLEDNGSSAKTVKKLLAAAGHSVSFDFFPWNRAVAEGLGNPEYVGYFPEYYSTALDAEKSKDGKCLFSNSFGSSPVGFVQQSNAPVKWTSYDDLKKLNVGVVSGYVNEERFDAMVADGSLKVQKVTADVLNIRKIAKGRLDLAVIDSNVLNYLLKADKSLTKLADKVEMNSKLLKEHGLHICFPNTETGKSARASFNKALMAN
ncbi:substrate-binding periplasmic protein [Sneathiella sp.]|uniref:substrate-binding periplasmic protein n=1 Tax=Sneathiella sp. TaxID=1964365 RepID=UPI0039E63214